MTRVINLRQIEAFKAVIENGTVSRAALALNISQPAMSKLIAYLEADTGLSLFDRVKRRLVPTEDALRLHDEVERIFSGVRQVENAVDAIRREKQGQLLIGAMPALAGSFIQRATTAFLVDRPNVFCSVQPLWSQGVVERLVSRSLDVGLVSADIDNPYVSLEPLMEHPLVCIMPLDHVLTEKTCISPADIEGRAFVSFNPDSYVGRRVQEVLDGHDVKARIALIAGGAQTVCEFVAAGMGISLVHPLMVSGLEGRLAVRPFRPQALYNFQIARSVENRNARLVDAFVQKLRDTAEQVSKSLLDRS